MSTAQTIPSSGQGSNQSRWIQLVIGIICMILIANLQYGWTLFVHPINVAHGWTIASIQVAFSIFVALETWLTPIEGWIADKLGPERGPKLVVAVGGLLVALGWIVNGNADTLGNALLRGGALGRRRRCRLRHLRRQRG